MTKPLRTFLLNEQISIEARKIAHKACGTCPSRAAMIRADASGLGGKVDDLPNHDEWHSPTCNKLKSAIEALCLNIKLAASQRPDPRREPPATQAESVLPYCGSWPECGCTLQSCKGANA